jgi:hypothetical protein
MTDASLMPPADWLPTQDTLLRGLNHALSNRLSSIGAIAMLTEGAETLDPKLQAALAKDVEQLGDLLALYRLLPGDAVARRDAARFSDALGRARALLEHHPDCRNVRFELGDGATAEPVSLLGRDALRASLLLLLGAARGTGGEGTVTVSSRGEDGWLHVTARSSRADAAIRASRECAVLSRWAEEEGGHVEPAADALTLVIPGLSRSRGATG